MNPNVVVIPLGCHGGKYVTFIDHADAAEVQKYNWRASVRKTATKLRIYAVRSKYSRDANGKRINDTVYLHRFLMDEPDGLMVDHRNGQPLDNRRSNLRLATPSQNAQNTIRVAHVSPHGRGVSKTGNAKTKRPYKVMINTGHGKRLYLGYYETAYEAGLVYDQWAQKLFGEFAVLNFPAVSTTSYPMAAE
uniref:HNH endonuclease n=1 Tax=Methylobacterium sp. B34 TaxID=95563 RepID=UPI00034CF975|nr:HNH endonuclease [Methylobacterium sp. B34]